jgi:hypothetical protein
MIIDIFIAIFQADYKIHEEFSKKINKIPPDKKKEIKIYIFITEKQDIELINISINQV